MYEYFVANGLNLLTAGGYFGFIVPDRLGFNAQFVELRKRILAETRVHSLVYKVPFPGITADTVVFIFEKTSPGSDWNVTISEFDRTPIRRSQGDLLQHPMHAFEYFENVDVMGLVARLPQIPFVARLGDICESTSGFGGKSALIHSERTTQREIPALKGESIGRYFFTKKRFWFEFRRQNITGRTTDKTKLGAAPKILIRKTGDSIVATFDNSGVFPEQSLYFLFNNHTNLEFRYFLGILNSRLLNTFYRAKSLTNKKSIAQVKKVDLDELPIRGLDFANPADKARHDRMVKLVDRMLALHTQLAKAKTPQAKSSLQHQIDATDRDIDRLVYELYGLTAEEIRIVEEATGK